MFTKPTNRWVCSRIAASVTPRVCIQVAALPCRAGGAAPEPAAAGAAWHRGWRRGRRRRRGRGRGRRLWLGCWCRRGSRGLAVRPRCSCFVREKRATLLQRPYQPSDTARQGSRSASVHEAVQVGSSTAGSRAAIKQRAIQQRTGHPAALALNIVLVVSRRHAVMGSNLCACNRVCARPNCLSVCM